MLTLFVRFAKFACEVSYRSTLAGGEESWIAANLATLEMSDEESVRVRARACACTQLVESIAAEPRLLSKMNSHLDPGPFKGQRHQIAAGFMSGDCSVLRGDGPRWQK